MSYLRYLFTILLTLTMFYGWASPSVATSQFVCRGVGLTEPERSLLWNLSDVSTLDKAGLNLAPRYVATSVHDGDSARTIISEIIDGRRMRYLVDGSSLIWIGEETPEMHIRVDTLCYTSALLPFGDVSIPLSLHYRSNVIRSDGTLVQSATYYPYGEPHRDPAASTTIGIAGPDLPMSATTSNIATNFITTSNELGEERAGLFLFNYQLQFGYHIRERIHNHFNSPLPSDDKGKNGDYPTSYAIECILGYHIKHKILFFDRGSNIPSYYEFFSKDARPAQTIIDKYGKLPN